MCVGTSCGFWQWYLHFLGLKKTSFLKNVFHKIVVTLQQHFHAFGVGRLNN